MYSWLSKNYHFISQSCVHYVRANFQNLGPKCKLAFWMRHLSPWTSLIPLQIHKPVLSPSVYIAIRVSGWHQVKVKLFSHVWLGCVQESINNIETKCRRNPFAGVNATIKKDCSALFTVNQNWKQGQDLFKTVIGSTYCR